MMCEGMYTNPPVANGSGAVLQATFLSKATQTFSYNDLIETPFYTEIMAAFL